MMLLLTRCTPRLYTCAQESYLNFEYYYIDWPGSLALDSLRSILSLTTHNLTQVTRKRTQGVRAYKTCPRGPGASV